MSDKPVELDMDSIARKNMDLTERLFSEGVTISYDKDGDTLFITIGDPREAITEQIVDSLFYRIEPVTLKVIGCIIIGFESDILTHNKLLRKLFQDGFEQLRKQGDSIKWEGPQAQKVKPLFELSTR